MPEPKKERAVRRHYTNAFKQQIVELCLAGHKCKRDISEEYGLSEGVLYEWIKLYKQYGAFDRSTIRASKETEVERLEKRIAKLELENSILKDVALMLGKSQEPNSKS